MKPMWSVTRCSLLSLFLLCMTAGIATADSDHPTRLLWGDTHVHTYLSGDAYGMGNRSTPDVAYRFARGEAVTTTGGATAQLKRPLDFIVITDHAESLGMLPVLMSGDERLANSPGGRSATALLNGTPPLSDVLAAPDADTFMARMIDIMAGKAAWNTEMPVTPEIRQEIWQRVIDNAERYNDPGRFTTLIGYEYSSNPPMLHRNVVFRDGPAKVGQTLPFSKYDSEDPVDLWAYLDRYRQQTAGDVISIPHNSNLSRGNMFRDRAYQGGPLSPDYARLRSDFEPVVEATQIKGDSETHPLISPEDEFADYESWWRPPQPVAATKDGKGSKAVKTEAKAKTKAVQQSKGQEISREQMAEIMKTDPTGRKLQVQYDSAGIATLSNTSKEDLARQSHVRSGLQIGLALERTLGVNPFQFGMIGSTDSHNALASADEDNYWGKMAPAEPSPFRLLSLSNYVASGYAAVWAEDNTREAIFAALRRREVYATTGPRMVLRFFGGYDFTRRDARRGDLVENGYRKGVPMGSDLAPSDTAPTFLIHAARDPDGAKLDRVQVIKGWLDRDNVTHEKVYDAVWAGRREPDEVGRLPALRSTVEGGTYRNRVGAASLTTVWQDPDFDGSQPAFYYVRVLEIKTPHWTAIDAERYGVPLPESLDGEHQERAYSSPIWYPGQDQ
ncbi:MAG: DUF3604 domain-containing protein [Pseudomonadota bacterium]